MVLMVGVGDVQKCKVVSHMCEVVRHAADYCDLPACLPAAGGGGQVSGVLNGALNGVFDFC
jgi:hypothetical protein